MFWLAAIKDNLYVIFIYIVIRKVVSNLYRDVEVYKKHGQKIKKI